LLFFLVMEPKRRCFSQREARVTLAQPTTTIKLRVSIVVKPELSLSGMAYGEPEGSLVGVGPLVVGTCEADVGPGQRIRISPQTIM